MDLQSLLAEAYLAEPQQPAREKWTQYKPIFFVLVNTRGFKKKAACDWISDKEGHSSEDRKLLYLATKSWKQEGEHSA